MNIKESLKQLTINFKTYFLTFIKWSALGITVGLLCGVLGAVFEKSVSAVTNLRAENGWLIFLLPVGGIISVAIYKLCKVTNIGTNDVFRSVRSEKSVPFLLAPAVFVGSVITHLFGGSAGREGAALQLGGSISGLLGKIFGLSKESQHILTVCGMGAFFSALFGTPLGACIFALEVVNVGHICSAAFLPAIISSITAYGTALLLGVTPEKFSIAFVPDFTLNTLWKVAVIGIVGAIVSIMFCFIMHFTHRCFTKLIKNDFLRIVAGALVVVALTMILGTTDYNGSGMEVIHRIFNGGTVSHIAFLIKIIFTAVTIAVGFKGGEIIPTLFIGATLGYSTAMLVGLNPAFGAAVGMAALFCGVTNCPIATVVLFVELFGGVGIVFFALSAIISFFLSGYSSLYSGQKLIFSKFTEEIIDKTPN